MNSPVSFSFKKIEVIVVCLFVAGLFVFAFQVRSEYKLENPNIEIQKISYPQEIYLSVKKNNKEEIKGKVKVADPYLISDIPENEFLEKYSYLKKGFENLEISIETDKALFRKENFYCQPSLSEKTKSLLGMNTLPSWRLIKQLDEKNKNLETKMNVPGFSLETIYKEQREKGNEFIQERKKIKQSLVLNNTSDKEINLQLSFTYIINATSVSAGGKRYFVSSVPKPLLSQISDSVYFESEGKIFSYHFSDLLEFNPELWFFQKESRNILLVKIFISLEPNSSIEIDPAYQVDTVPSGSPACCYSFQRKTWWDGTRYWVAFWSDNDNRIEFWYSTDGSSWTENTSARLSIDTNDFSILGDSSNLFIVYPYSGDIYARQATSYPGTSFGWGSQYGVFGLGIGISYAYPYINRDSSNYLWVIARQYDSFASNPYSIRVARSYYANNVSSWTNRSNIDTASTNSNKYGVIAPRNNQYMYAVWIDGTTIYGRPYNPSLGWGTTVTIDSYGESGLANNMSIVHDSNGYLHLVNVHSDPGGIPGTYGIFYRRFTTSWQTAVQLSTEADDDYPTITINTNNNDLYVFWRDTASTIVYRKGVSPYGASNWDSAVTFRDAGSGTTTECLTSNYRDNNKIFLEWKEVPTDAVNGNIMWGEITLNNPPEVGTIILNSGNDIVLTENTTTTVLATTTVSDEDGYSDITSVQGKLYRTGVGANCTTDGNNCYRDSSCATSSCAGNSCVATCEYNVWFHADPTDAGTWSTEAWRAYVRVYDSQNATDEGYSGTVEMKSLKALDVATARQYYNSGDNDEARFFHSYWRAQTFTVGNSSHTIVGVRLKLYRTGSPGTIIVSINETKDGAPAAKEYTTGRTDGNTLPTSCCEWRYIPVTPYTLSANTTYAIVVRTQNGDEANYGSWRTGIGGYSGGSGWSSSDNGSNWIEEGYDFMFEEYGSGGPIDYGTLNPGDDTGTLNQNTIVTDTGNIAIDAYIYGTDLESGANSIAVGQQEYSTSSGVSYGSGTDATSSSNNLVELDLSKPTSHPSTSTDDVWWGLGIPSVQPAGTYTGTTTFSVTSD